MDKRRLFCLILVTALLIPFQNCSQPFESQFNVLSGLGGGGGGGGPTPETPELPLSKIFPIVNLTTTGAADITSKDVYVNGRFVIDPNGSPGAVAFDATMKIKGRGNSTWGMPKKPYKIKLDAKASVLGMPSDKEWVLLANYSDKTLLRTYLAFEMGRRLGMPYVPRAKFVEVNLNGAYLGNYLLTEQIKIAPDRVNITPLTATDLTGDAVTGGYLVELNERLDEPVSWRTTRNVAYTVKEPDLVADQVTWLKNYMQSVEDNLYSPAFADPVTGYEKDINTDTFINYFLVNEVFKNVDAAAFSSIFLYKERGQKLAMGPLWDFDLAAGNVNYSDAQTPEGWYLKALSPWFKKLFEDPVFTARVKVRWNEMKVSKFDTLLPLMDKYAEMMGPSQTRNFERWPILDVYVWPNQVVTGSYQGEIDYAKDFLTKRIKWMDEQINAP